MTIKNKIGIFGDMHLRDSLSYSENISDRREAEKKEVLDFIVESSKDCTDVVFMGDNFHSRNNSSETNREFVELLERLDNKGIYVLVGNHEKKGDGKTAIDFLKEVKHSNWHIFTKPHNAQIGNLKVSFLPYMLKSELGTENDEQSTEKIVKDLPGGDILFAHHSISDTTFNGLSTNALKEVVLPKMKLEEKYKQIIAGHIHVPGVFGKTVLTGSVFNNEVSEIGKFIYKIGDDLKVEQIKIPGRGIYKLENPTSEELAKLPKESIVKVIINDKTINMEEIKNSLTRFDASLILEQFHNERKKMHNVQNGALDFSPENLLKMYSEERGMDLSKLLRGFELIKN